MSLFYEDPAHEDVVERAAGPIPRTAEGSR